MKGEKKFMKYFRIIKKYVINTAIIFALFFVSTIVGFYIPNSEGITFSDYNSAKIKVDENESLHKKKQDQLNEINNNIKVLNNEIVILNNEVTLEESK